MLTRWGVLCGSHISSSPEPIVFILKEESLGTCFTVPPSFGLLSLYVIKGTVNMYKLTMS